MMQPERDSEESDGREVTGGAVDRSTSGWRRESRPVACREALPDAERGSATN
jgi:hypothetical protein